MPLTGAEQPLTVLGNKALGYRMQMLAVEGKGSRGLGGVLTVSIIGCQARPFPQLPTLTQGGPIATHLLRILKLGNEEGD